MLRPNKFSHPDQTVMNAAFLILKKIKKERVISYDELDSYLQKKIANGRVLFMDSINFLFMLGILTYHSKNDSFEFVEKNNEIV